MNEKKHRGHKPLSGTDQDWPILVLRLSWISNARQTNDGRNLKEAIQQRPEDKVPIFFILLKHCRKKQIKSMFFLHKLTYIQWNDRKKAKKQVCFSQWKKKDKYTFYLVDRGETTISFFSFIIGPITQSIPTTNKAIQSTYICKMIQKDRWLSREFKNSISYTQEYSHSLPGKKNVKKQTPL